LRLWKGDVATRTRDPGRGCAIGGGFIGGIDGAGGHASVAMVKGAIVELAVPTVFSNVRGTELVPESENAVRTQFRGIKVVLGAFEGSELVDREVLWKAFDREAGKIIRHSMRFLSADRSPFNSFVLVADCSSLVDW